MLDKLRVPKEDIQKISEVVRQHGRIDYAFLFGSYLNHPLEDSDVDILLGASLEPSEKLNLAMQLELILKRKVDIVIAAEASCELLLNALSQGLPLIINDKERLKKDYFKNFRLFDERTSLRMLRMKKIKSKYCYD
jgi:predicted nucleotidyltransferase